MQNELKHTPLPWETTNNLRSESIEIVPPIRETGGRWNANHCVAEFYGPDREANAALFMSAPDLKAENERLRNHNANRLILLEQAHKSMEQTSASNNRLEKRIDEIVAENERLKAAMQQIEDCYAISCREYVDKYGEGLKGVREIANQFTL